MTADNWKPQKYLSQQPRDMRFMPFVEDTQPEYVPSGVMALIVGLGVLAVCYVLASVL